MLNIPISQNILQPIIQSNIQYVESIEELFGAERSKAGLCMPPQGLCLMEVGY